jgi:hypothetical protein
MTDEQRIAELEDQLKEAERRIAELRQERDDARDLVQRQAEHVHDCRDQTERWIEAFDMSLNEEGDWVWQRAFVQGEEWYHKYVDLLKKWNKLIPKYNAAIVPKDVGRPLQASQAQCKEVVRLHKSGASLRAIADDTSLSTVRTIVGRQTGADRTTRKRMERIMPDRLKEASWNAKLRSRKALPRQINESLKAGEALTKEAKGLA